MSIFGFGTPAELQTPIGIQIKAATDSLRLTPDWAKNIDICDEINRKNDAPDHAVKALKKRLQDSDQQTVYLSLILLEACMKNCGTNFAASFDKALMDEMVNISKGNKGNKNADESIRLIQAWARMYERNKSFTLFFDTYMSLKSRGVAFPKEETEPVSDGGKAPASVSKPSANESERSDPPQQPQQPNINEFEKLRSDISVVVEKIKLCREMLFVSPGIHADEALADVIGFLEACRDRFVDLVEAGAQGLLGEELFEQVLRVNDAVYRTLEAEKSGTRIEVEDGFTTEQKKQSSGNLLDLDSSPVAVNQGHSVPKSDDPFEGLFGSAAKSAPSMVQNNQSQQNSAPSVAPSKPVHTPDEFDLLFNPTSSNSATAPLPNPPREAAAKTEAPPPADDFDAFFASLK